MVTLADARLKAASSDSDAEKVRLSAMATEMAMNAENARAMNEAENAMSPEVIDLARDKARLEMELSRRAGRKMRDCLNFIEKSMTHQAFGLWLQCQKLDKGAGMRMKITLDGIVVRVQKSHALTQLLL